MKILLVAINAKYIHSNPAVISLKASADRFLKEKDVYSEDIIEIAEYAINQPDEYILSDIYVKRPDVIAFSCYIWNVNTINRITANLTSILPTVSIWLGGPEASYNAVSMMKNNMAITGIMYGEGEIVFSELANYYVQRVDTYSLESIKGLYYRKDDEVVFTGEHPLTDINDIPFVYDDLSQFENKIIYYESSRGCPFRCSYCLSSIDKTVRLKSIDRVLEELKYFLDNKVPQVKFIDRTFNCNREHALTIWRFLQENDNGITNFHFEIAADLIGEEELEVISLMRPGLIQLEIGVQTTNLATIKEIRRTMNLEKLKNVVDRIHSFNNTHQHLDLIAGLPYEDLESFEKSFNDVYAFKPNQLQLGFLKVLKGSYMEEMKDIYGLKYMCNAPYEVLSSKWLSYEDILLLKGIEEMVELYYNTGQFDNTIAFLVKQFESPFAMFKALSEDYKANGYDLRKPARSYRYEMLYNFVLNYDSKNINYYRELLTLDEYLREKCKVRPVFARDLSDYKDIIREIKLEKSNHLEVFCYINPLNGEIIKEGGKPVFAEFDYDDRNPLNHNARIKIV